MPISQYLYHAQILDRSGHLLGSTEEFSSSGKARGAARREMRAIARQGKLLGYYGPGWDVTPLHMRIKKAATGPRGLELLRNPAKGRKVKGGRAVTLKNFTGTVTRLNSGQIKVEGRGRK